MLLLAGNILLNRFSKECSYFALQLQGTGCEWLCSIRTLIKIGNGIGQLETSTAWIGHLHWPIAKSEESNVLDQH